MHRLDKDTSGIVVFAKNEKLKKACQNSWNTLAKTREYHALVSGKPKNKSGQVKSYLKETKTFQVYNTSEKFGKLALTNYEVLKSNKEYSLIKINILTGRKSQIRLAMRDLNCPIVGDKKYGSLKNPYRRLCLHASKLVLVHPFTKKEMTFTAEIPKIFLKPFEEK